MDSIVLNLEFYHHRCLLFIGKCLTHTKDYWNA
uniref:Uncharacterized protein n=1 Tax=Tetranychus urticae TaxID=32264 RepID=T1KAJ3_TETUR